ncbi:hypothetical protein [Paludibacterium sp. B53371]|uniref:hypothetical protein n=1 Tax=Paludibacterium sp. B53371 TaxID=2806263 RepID=UPI001C04BD92|nr:hypothetical protein [Paludibacterium sp. B53371]
MLRRFTPVIVVFATALLSACSSTMAPVAGTDNVCVGEVQPMPPGVVEVADPALLARALGAPLQGKLCQGKVGQLQAGQTLTVYRVWDSSKPYTALGGWWSLQRPQGPRDAYRLANDICPSWSALDHLSRCTLKPGARMVLGPGQSAQCGETQIYPPSAVNQVYLPNDAQHQQVVVEHCEDLGSWPTPP